MNDGTNFWLLVCSARLLTDTPAVEPERLTISARIWRIDARNSVLFLTFR